MYFLFIALTYSLKNVLSNQELYYVENCVIKNMNSTTTGGAFNIDRNGCNMTILRCGFSNCSCKDQGGAICVRNSFEIVIKSTCFLKCQGGAGPSYVLWANGNNLLYSTMNFTDESYPSSSGHSSWFAGLQGVNFYNNNNSNSITTGFAGGITLSKSFKSYFGSYNQVCNTNSKCFICFSYQDNSINRKITHFNFINNTVSVAWIQIHEGESIILLESCVMSKNTNIKALDYSTNGKGSLTMLSCTFDFSPTSQPSVQIISSAINSPPNTIQLMLQNTQICWDDATLLLTYQNSRNYELSYSYLLLLIAQ